MKTSNKETIIEAGKIEQNYWLDVWKARELLLFFSMKEFLLRYKQTFFGITWAIIQPLTSIFIFTFIFSEVAKISSIENVPYFIIVFTGVIPWQLISNVLPNMNNSLISNNNLINKIYFPRILLPMSMIMLSLIDFIISFLMLLAVLLITGVGLTYKIIFLPLVLVFAILLSSSIGVLTASLSVKFRDFKYLVPFLVRVLSFLAPVGFSSQNIPDQWKFIYYLNPATTVIESFRWIAIPNYKFIQFFPTAISIVLTIILLIISLNYFRKTEETFADKI